MKTVTQYLPQIQHKLQSMELNSILNKTTNLYTEQLSWLIGTRLFNCTTR